MHLMAWLSLLCDSTVSLNPAVGFFHGHGNVDGSFLTFRARLTTIFFPFQLSCPAAPSPSADNNSRVTRQNFWTTGPHRHVEKAPFVPLIPYSVLELDHAALARKRRKNPSNEKCASTIVASPWIINISISLIRSPRQKGADCRS